jgi:peptidoglycan/xylan/chitin deacetylase (PgdA/CDA1 family)
MSLRNRKKILATLAPFVNFSGMPRWLGKKHVGLGTILMFHRVLPATTRARVHNHESLEVDLDQLEKTIDFFRSRNYDFISLDQVSKYLEGGRNKFVIFTFDDGYVDNLENAYPIFKKHCIPFTIYVTTNFINRTAVVWWYLLEEILLKNTQISLNWKGDVLHYTCRSIQEKEATFVKIRNLIMHQLDPANHLKDFEELFAGYIDDLFAFTNKHMASWAQLSSIANDPLVTLAAHTANHLPLKLLSLDGLKKEVLEARAELAYHTKTEIKHFAYPYGKLTEAGEREYRFVSRHGFATAVTTNIGNVKSEHLQSMCQLPRVNVNVYTTPAVLEMHISGFISKVKSWLKI